MPTYLKQHYLDDWKLAQRALLELHRAIDSRRLIAFTGAMTTESLGYPSWKELNKVVSKTFEELLPEGGVPASLKSVRARLIAQLGETISADKRIDARTVFSLVAETLEQYERISCPDSQPLKEIERAVAERFLGGHQVTAPSTIAALREALGTDRFATLNYDLELEALLMLDPSEREAVGDRPYDKFERQMKAKALYLSKHNGHMRRIMPNGRTVESDIVSRERTDGLIEFALGAVDAEQHILHLHGRAEDPQSLILSYRDYDRLYRRDDVHRLPFEHGYRIMIGGNPILFVGLGMKEPEVNETLEHFISNSPYHRTAPTFLLWNTRDLTRTMDPDARADFRTDKLHRLGVLTIFDTDLEEELTSAPPRDRAAVLAQLEQLVRKLPETARIVGQREAHIGTLWRSMAKRVEATANVPIILWDVSGDPDEQTCIDNRQRIAELAGKFHAKEPPTIAIAIGPPGCGKGSIGRAIVDHTGFPAGPGNRLSINAGFSFDTDSLLDAVYRFLRKQSGTAGQPEVSRRRFFESDLAGKPMVESLIIINGMERFFDIEGRPLSAELDHLLDLSARGCLHKSVKWVLLGSERCRAYFDKLNERIAPMMGAPRIVIVDIDRCAPVAPQADDPRNIASASRYFGTILAGRTIAFTYAEKQRMIEEANNLLNANGDSRRGPLDGLRRAFLDALLEPARLTDLLPPSADVALCLEILRALAFVGLPAERAVLHAVPRVYQAAAGTRARRTRVDGTTEDKIDQAIDALHRARLIVKLRGFEGDGASGGMPRYALHRTVMAELRYRFGLPLSEAKLSTAFNMSLYVAQPVDGYIPEPELHDELGDLIDALIGAYRVDDGNMVPPPNCLDAGKVAPFGREDERILQESRFNRRLCMRESVACLRAALAVVRGYYTTTGLLTLDRGDRLIADDRDGVLLEHAERLDRLIDGYGKMVRLRNVLREELGDAAFEEDYGAAEPFYPDELVWLHNERGVVRLAMGDLYESDRSFQRAMRVNQKHVEFEDHAHNWRRIRLNQITVAIERADLAGADRLVREVLAASTYAPKVSETASTRYYPLREDELAAAIATGYRGMIQHLRGELIEAYDDYRVCTKALRTIDEQRAYAYFQRLRGVAAYVVKGREIANIDLELALDAAQSTRQMDVLYRAKILIGRNRANDSSAARQSAARDFTAAIHYAHATDMHRVLVEAAGALARIKLNADDPEVALQYCAQAMTIATRYGMELRKISLRITLAQILVRRGDRKTGENLVRKAINAANRIGYQRGVESGQQALLDLGQ